MLPDTGFWGSQTLASWKGGRFPSVRSCSCAQGFCGQSTTTWVAKPQKHVVSELWRLRSLKSMCWPGWFPLSTILENLSYTPLSTVDFLPESWRFFHFRLHRVRTGLVLAGDARDLGLDPDRADPLEQGMATHSLYSCRENSKDSRAWWGDSPRCHKERLTRLSTRTQHSVFLSLWSHNSSSYSDALRPPHQHPVTTHIGLGAHLPPVKPHPNSICYICNAISNEMAFWGTVG